MAATRSPRPAFRPRLESLDDRITPAAGDLDPTFGAGGIAAPPLGRTFLVTDTVVQPDGKILATGTTPNTANPSKIGGLNSPFLLVRHNPDGSLDPSFGTGGVVTTEMTNWTDSAAGVALRPDGKIVVGGTVTESYDRQTGQYRYAFGVARYLPDGRLDPTFDGDGKATAQLASRSSDQSRLTELAVQPDGKVVAAGYASGPYLTDAVVARFTTAGRLDPTFDGDGKVPLDLGQKEYPEGLALQPDGKIVLAGDRHTDSAQTNSYDTFVARLNPAGQLDPTFGRDADGNGVRDGWAATDVVAAGASQNNRATALALQGDRIVVGGNFTVNGPTATSTSMVLTGYTTAGDLDPTFGQGGVAVLFVNGYFLKDMVADPLGRLVFVGAGPVVGSTDPNLDADYLVGRFTPDGSLDPGFGTGGVVRTDPSGVRDEFHADAALQPDGRIVAAGRRREASGQYTYTIARYLGDDPPAAATSVAPPVFKTAGTGNWDDPDPLAPYVG